MRTTIISLVLFLCVGCTEHSSPSDLEKPVGPVCRLQHPDLVSSVLFWPKQEVLVTGCWDGSIRFWDYRTGRLTNEWKAHKGELTALALSREGILASAGCDSTVRVWKGPSGTKLKEFKTEGAAHSLAFSADGRLLCCSTNLMSRYLWDLPGDCVIPRSDDYWTWAVAFSPTGNVLAFARERGIVMVIDDPFSGSTRKALELDKHEVTAEGAITHHSAVWSVAFSPDGRTLAAFGESEDLILWEVLTGHERRRLNTEESIGISMAFSPNGKILASGEGFRFRWQRSPGEFDTCLSPNKDPYCARLWDIRSSKPVCRLEHNRGGTRSVSFSGDGKLLATGNEDQTAAVWDVSEFTKDPDSNGPEPSLGDPEVHWRNLTGDNAVLAFDSILAMSASPKQSLPFLRTKLRPVPTVEKGKLQSLLKDLDSDDFPTRQHASEELNKFGEGAEPILRERLSKHISAESRNRITSILEKSKSSILKPEIIAMLRGVETLERIGSDDAVEILETLAKGVPSARITQEAKNSINRIKERASTRARD